MNIDLIIFKIIFIGLYIFATYIWINATNHYLLYKNYNRKCINLIICIIYILTSTGVFISYLYGIQIFIASSIIYTIVALITSGFLNIAVNTNNNYVPLE